MLSGPASSPGTPQVCFYNTRSPFLQPNWDSLVNQSYGFATHMTLSTATINTASTFDGGSVTNSDLGSSKFGSSGTPIVQIKQLGTVALSGATIPANGYVVQTFTATGLAPGDHLICNPNGTDYGSNVSISWCAALTNQVVVELWDKTGVGFTTGANTNLDIAYIRF